MYSVRILDELVVVVGSRSDTTSESDGTQVTKLVVSIWGPYGFQPSFGSEEVCPGSEEVCPGPNNIYLSFCFTLQN